MEWSAGDAVGALNAQAIAMGWGMRCYEDLHFVRPEINDLRAVWNTRARETGLPSRADFDARALKPFLPNLSIVERVAGGAGAWRYRFRLSGTAIVHLFGESTGRYLDEVLPAPFVERWTLAYDTVLAHARPLRFVSRFQISQVSWLDGESFSAPLANPGALPHLILGALYVAPRQVMKAAG